MEFITLKGRLTKDAEKRATTSGVSVVKFSIAINKGKDKPARFYSCSLWGSRGDKLFQYLTKGKEVLVTGDLDYYTGNDGKEYAEVKVASFDFCGGIASGDSTPKTVDRFAPPSEDDDLVEMMDKAFKGATGQPTPLPSMDEEDLPF